MMNTAFYISYTYILLIYG